MRIFLPSDKDALGLGKVIGFVLPCNFAAVIKTESYIA